MGVCVENLLNPIRTINNIKSKLISLYVLDYGNDSKDIINRRWDNTIFMTDVLPTEMKKFIDKYDICDVKFVLRTNIECSDYMKKQTAIDKAIKEEFENYMAFKHQMFSKKDLAILWLKKNYTTEDCCKYGYNVIDSVMREKDRLLQGRKLSIIKNTLWGMRMQLKYKELSREQLAELLLQDDFPAITCVVKNKKNQFRTICQVPLIRYEEMPSLDRMFLHEVRHVVETEGLRSGLDEFPLNTYNHLNEIRVEKNAIEDEKKLPLLFSRTSSIAQSMYDLLIPNFEEMGDFKSYLDKLSFYGDFEEDRDLLASLNKHLFNAEIERNKEKIRVK